jgi:hypothetical protein
MAEEKSIGAAAAILRGIEQGAASLADGLGQVWDAAKPMFDHGRSEVAAAIFSGHGHVMYMHGGEDRGQNEGHGLPVEPLKQPEMEM